MSQNLNCKQAHNPEEPVSANIDIDKCEKIGCNNRATVKPVVQLREHAAQQPQEAAIGIKICRMCATEKAAYDLVDGAKQKGMMQDIYRMQVQDKDAVVDWSCSGVVWVSIN